MKFVNRSQEIDFINKYIKRHQNLAVVGRRRVGKSRLIRHSAKDVPGIYSQCIESETSLQIDQIFEDLTGHINTEFSPTTWPQLFELFDKLDCRWLCLDEFPYLVKQDPSLPNELRPPNPHFSLTVKAAV